MCPIRYGQAVYLARNLITTQPGLEGVSWNDNELCVYGVTFRRAKTDSVMIGNNVFTVFPNPANNQLFFSLQDMMSNKDIAVIKIIDTKGSVVITRRMESNVSKGVIDISLLTNGMYLLEATSNDGKLYHAKFEKHE
jgi:hypothetical protein